MRGAEQLACVDAERRKSCLQLRVGACAPSDCRCGCSVAHPTRTCSAGQNDRPTSFPWLAHGRLRGRLQKFFRPALEESLSLSDCLNRPAASRHRVSWAKREGVATASAALSFCAHRLGPFGITSRQRWDRGSERSRQAPRQSLDHPNIVPPHRASATQDLAGRLVYKFLDASLRARAARLGLGASSVASYFLRTTVPG